MTPEELDKIKEQFKDDPNVYFIEQPKRTEEGYENPAFINELQGLLKHLFGGKK